MGYDVSLIGAGRASPHKSYLANVINLSAKQLLYNYLTVVVERGRMQPFGDIVPVYVQLVLVRPFYWLTYARVARDSLRRVLRLMT